MRFNPTFTANLTNDIQQSEQNLQTAMQQVSTEKSVNLPSDNPAASALMLQNLSLSASDDQYSVNATTVASQAQTASGVLSSVVTLLNQAISVGTEGANSIESTVDRQTIATKVQGLLSSLVAYANTPYQGAALFAGTASGSTAFQPDSTSSTGYKYTGNNNVNYVAAGQTLNVQANIPGDTLFLQSGASAIGSLSQLANALTSGSSAAIGTAVVGVTSALNYVSQQQAVYGNTVNQLNTQETFLSQEKVTLTSQQNSLVGVDTATAAENLAQAETENSAILSAAAQVLPKSLLSYLNNG
jgi:flagellar hook-associated protein 3 FlgL